MSTMGHKAIALERLTDAVHLSFTMRPEVNPHRPFKTDDLQVHIHIPRAFKTNRDICAVIDEIREIFCQKIGAVAVQTMNQCRLNVSPGQGSSFQDGQLVLNEVLPSFSVTSRPSTPSCPSTPSRPSRSSNAAISSPNNHRTHYCTTVLCAHNTNPPRAI
ncbi:MAG TPA: hypothetical protein VGO47_01700, partial [Chlamydiales bacterium]|nr:hypothetical protein [Chlamydiales bacterium]